jgi:hypothetical protein
MVDSAGNKLEGVFEAQTAEPADGGGSWPSPEDGVRLVQALVCIRSPERRQAVLEYALDQAKMDLRQKPDGAWEVNTNDRAGIRGIRSSMSLLQNS